MFATWHDGWFQVRIGFVNDGPPVCIEVFCESAVHAAALESSRCDRSRHLYFSRSHCAISILPISTVASLMRLFEIRTADKIISRIFGLVEPWRSVISIKPDSTRAVVAPLCDGHAGHSQNKHRLVALGAVEIRARFRLVVLSCSSSARCLLRVDQAQTRCHRSGRVREKPAQKASR